VSSLGFFRRVDCLSSFGVHFRGVCVSISLVRSTQGFLVVRRAVKIADEWRLARLFRLAGCSVWSVGVVCLFHAVRVCRLRALVVRVGLSRLFVSRLSCAGF